MNWPLKGADMIAKATIFVLIVHQLCYALDFLEYFQPRRERSTKVSVHEDARLSVPQLLTKYGYPNEIHHATTEDGYILELHRVLPKSSKPKNIPVILMHPLLCTSAEFVINGPKKSFAYILANQGYDVWLGNVRGNTYSLNHTTLDSSDPAFWEFSFHEIASYDLSAIIDYALKTSGKEKFHYVGHSQGCLTFFLLCTLRPYYNDKVLSMNAFAPAAHIGNLKSNIVRTINFLAFDPEQTAKWVTPGVFMPRMNDFIFAIANFFCNERAITQEICSTIVFSAVGFDSPQLNRTMLPVYFGHTPAGCSVYQIIQFAQYIVTGEFKMYDYGKTKNLLKYGSEKPPKYNLSRVTAPVAMHYASNDWLVTPEDVFKTKAELSNVVLVRKVPDENFNHLDFSWAKDANVLVFESALEVMKEYEKL